MGFFAERPGPLIQQNDTFFCWPTHMPSLVVVLATVVLYFTLCMELGAIKRSRRRCFFVSDDVDDMSLAQTLRPLARVQCMDKPVCKISTLRKATQKLWASTAAGRLIKAASPKSKRSSPKNALALSCPDLKQTISRMTENNPGRTVVRESRSAMHGSDKRGLQPNDLCQDTFASILPDIEAARAGRGAEGYTTSKSGGWESSVPQLPCVAGKSKGHKGGIQLVAKGAKIHKRNRFRDLPVSRMPSSPTKPKTKSMEWAELVAQHRKEEDMREAVYAMDTLHNTPVLNFHVVNTPKHMQSPGGNNLRQSMDF